MRARVADLALRSMIHGRPGAALTAEAASRAATAVAETLGPDGEQTFLRDEARAALARAGT